MYVQNSRENRMAKTNSLTEDHDVSSSSRSNRTDIDNVNEAQVTPPPQSKCSDANSKRSQDDATPFATDATQIQDQHSKANNNPDDDINKLTKGIQSVSLVPKPITKQSTEPAAIRRFAALLSSKKYRNIVVLTGAGVSCNAGIPDFRTPGTGL